MLVPKLFRPPFLPTLTPATFEQDSVYTSSETHRFKEGSRCPEGHLFTDFRLQTSDLSVQHFGGGDIWDLHDDPS